MRTPQISVSPLPCPSGDAPRLGLFVDGIYVRGVKTIMAHEGADVLVVLDRDHVRVGSCGPRPPFSGGIVPPGTRLATDGQA